MLNSSTKKTNAAFTSGAMLHMSSTTKHPHLSLSNPPTLSEHVRSASVSPRRESSLFKQALKPPAAVPQPQVLGSRAKFSIVPEQKKFMQAVIFKTFQDGSLHECMACLDAITSIQYLADFKKKAVYGYLTSTLAKTCILNNEETFAILNLVCANLSKDTSDGLIDPMFCTHIEKHLFHLTPKSIDGSEEFSEQRFLLSENQIVWLAFALRTVNDIFLKLRSQYSAIAMCSHRIGLRKLEIREDLHSSDTQLISLYAQRNELLEIWNALFITADSEQLIDSREKMNFLIKQALNYSKIKNQWEIVGQAVSDKFKQHLCESVPIYTDLFKLIGDLLCSVCAVQEEWLHNILICYIEKYNVNDKWLNVLFMPMCFDGIEEHLARLSVGKDMPGVGNIFMPTFKALLSEEQVRLVVFTLRMIQINFLLFHHEFLFLEECEQKISHRRSVLKNKNLYDLDPELVGLQATRKKLQLDVRHWFAKHSIWYFLDLIEISK